ncbi:hypothetical protein [Amycolatopsis nalaikhensis]|uniref:Serine/threonine protein kinase n=1 Tax=Amycolatopsis nalaikhensis TaxID=715472 RepID=A0ABY8XUF6_9PSEU|nr:hypothetical protein [Amycolatopsis sp. 2-2]WIV59286.1 hypothetical protein QP939_11990 [Amycolatopsis sp. 2-2]
MSGRPTWGSAAVTGLAGFATGLLVAALLIAGRNTPRPAEVTAPPSTSATRAEPVTVTAPVPTPPTVTAVETSPPTTTTRVVEVTVTTSPTSTTPTSTSTLLPLTSSWRD